jgi:hypothetical protein
VETLRQAQGSGSVSGLVELDVIICSGSGFGSVSELAELCVISCSGLGFGQ